MLSALILFLLLFNYSSTNAPLGMCVCIQLSTFASVPHDMTFISTSVALYFSPYFKYTYSVYKQILVKKRKKMSNNSLLKGP